MACTCHPSDSRKQNWEITVQATLSKKVRPNLKNNQGKRARGMAQAVEYLPSKHKALSSSPSTAKKKKKKKRIK
jgi:hypothetical protein